MGVRTSAYLFEDTYVEHMFEDTTQPTTVPYIKEEKVFFQLLNEIKISQSDFSNQIYLSDLGEN